NSLIVDPRDPDWLWTTGPGAAYRSTNGGKEWEKALENGSIPSVPFNPPMDIAALRRAAEVRLLAPGRFIHGKSPGSGWKAEEVPGALDTSGSKQTYFAEIIHDDSPDKRPIAVFDGLPQVLIRASEGWANITPPGLQPTGFVASRRDSANNTNYWSVRPIRSAVASRSGGNHVFFHYDGDCGWSYRCSSGGLILRFTY
ncbi:MAG: hypothetical protein ACRDLB_00335, partial [Actinomycetota bacterium]